MYATKNLKNTIPKKPTLDNTYRYKMSHIAIFVCKVAVDVDVDVTSAPLDGHFVGQSRLRSNRISLKVSTTSFSLPEAMEENAAQLVSVRPA